MANLTPIQQVGLQAILQAESEYLIGVDEVGYGSWAGPLLVAGAVCKKGWAHPDSKDSKKLSAAKRRKVLATVLVPPAIIRRTIVVVPVGEIDRLGVLVALHVATIKAVSILVAVYPDSTVVLDGDQPSELQSQCVTMPKADALVPIVGAASIIAKVKRDGMMGELAKKYPGYGFETNMGYGTEQHRRAVEELGPCEIHRYGYKPIVRASRRQRAAVRLQAWRSQKKEMPESTLSKQLSKTTRSHGDEPSMGK